MRSPPKLVFPAFPIARATFKSELRRLLACNYIRISHNWIFQQGHVSFERIASEKDAIQLFFLWMKNFFWTKYKILISLHIRIFWKLIKRQIWKVKTFIKIIHKIHKCNIDVITWKRSVVEVDWVDWVDWEKRPAIRGLVAGVPAISDSAPIVLGSVLVCARLETAPSRARRRTPATAKQKLS